MEYKGKEYEVLFRHDRTKDGDKIASKGGKTTAYIRNDKREDIISEISVCSMKDNYSKRIGRLISEGRLRKLVLNA